jgi:hypothetical protein
LSVTVVAALYVAVGALNLAYYLVPSIAGHMQPGELLLAEATEAVAVVSGAFMLRGARWAQWLALAWIAFHVMISVGSVQKIAVHGLLLVIIAVCLLHRRARAYFQPL